MDSYFYQPYDYSSFGSIPPPSSTSDFDYDLYYSSIFEEDQQLLLDLQNFLSDPNSFSPVSSDPYLPPQNLHNQIHFDLDYSTIFPTLPIIDPVDDYFFAEPAPKRQKCFDYEPVFNNNNSYSNFLPKQEVFCACSKEKEKVSGARANAQSVAARERRKKISDKTQELSKLVPGANTSKMNTAEMLQSAFKYVQFLQAQVSVLELMGSDSVSKEGMNIVGASAVQEKLYMKDKCLAPVEFIEKLAGDEDVKREDWIGKELMQLMKSA